VAEGVRGAGVRACAVHHAVRARADRLGPDGGRDYRGAEGGRVPLPLVAMPSGLAPPGPEGRPPHRGGAVGKAIAALVPVCYFTLTLDQRAAALAGVTVAGSFAFLRDLWWDLRRELARNGLLGEFVFSIEQHRTGWAHANVIGTGGLAEAVATGAHAEAQADLVERAVAIGFGPQCVLHEELGRPGLFMYLAKYLGKSGQLPTAAPKGTRRMASSPKALAPHPPKRMKFLDWATAEEAAEGVLCRRLPVRAMQG